jgi:hypothetical protein
VETSTLVAGDDLGRISLYHYPAASTNASSVDYCYHFGAVTSLAFVG